MFLCYSQYIGHVVSEAQILQRPLDMFACDGLLRFLLADIIRLGGDECDELDAAFDQEVAGIFGKGLAG